MLWYLWDPIHKSCLQYSLSNYCTEGSSILGLLTVSHQHPICPMKTWAPSSRQCSLSVQKHLVVIVTSYLAPFALYLYINRILKGSTVKIVQDKNIGVLYCFSDSHSLIILLLCPFLTVFLVMSTFSSVLFVCYYLQYLFMVLRGQLVNNDWLFTLLLKYTFACLN